MKLGTHENSGRMYCAYQNQAAAYLSLYFFIFLSLQFSDIQIFRHTLLMNCETKKIETSYTRGQWADDCLYRNQAAAAYLSLYFFIIPRFEKVGAILDLPCPSVIL